jgi:hypothetical protein
VSYGGVDNGLVIDFGYSFIPRVQASWIGMEMVKGKTRFGFIEIELFGAIPLTALLGTRT